MFNKDTVTEKQIMRPTQENFIQWPSIFITLLVEIQ